ncbi:MAG: hypothetical protein JKY15_02005 [Deltaproteobacteria bacterium]|nr:hypothetical protein [Deltaproteobacteria bacterium]
MVNLVKVAPDIRTLVSQLPSAVGGWVELGRGTLGSPGDNIDVSSLPNKRYYMILAHHLLNTTNPMPTPRFNSDIGNNYARRFSQDGGADGTTTGISSIFTDTLGGTGDQWFQVFYLSNLAAVEKLLHMHMVTNRGGTGAGIAPTRYEIAGKWANTVDPLDEVNYLDANVSAGNFATGSQVVVLGWDPADVHTNNSWEELASVELGATADKITLPFTAKKYLWVKCWINPTGGRARPNIRMGAGSEDTGTNYANRRSQNNSAEQLNTNLDFINSQNLASIVPQFQNFFIVNNATHEKLVTGNWMDQGGAGAANAPQRSEFVGKWANAVSQADRVIIYNDEAGDFAAGSIGKVWGFD